MVVEVAYLAIVPFILSFLVLSIFAKRLNRFAPFISIFLAAVSLAILAVSFLEFDQTIEVKFSWLTFANINFTIGFLMDKLSMMFALLVSIISFFVLVYSYSYMDKKDALSRFHAEMSLFAGSMLGIVLSSNFITLLIFWEIVGLSSYLLIGFWHYKKEAARAAKKAFVIIILGDVFMFAGIAFLATQFPSLDFNYLNSNATSSPFLTIAMSLILVGAIAKSAQFPLHVWLGDAMEGPTPVSTLLHSATMVKAGIFLVARLLPLYSLAHLLDPIALIGVATAFIGATIAFSEIDIKRVLAFSTVSQLGFMMLALGASKIGASMLYSFTQTFSKAAIFMIAGIIMHSLKEQRDLRKIRIRPKSMIFYIALLGMLVMSGLPPFGDFFGKDTIVGSAMGYNTLFFVTILFTSFISTLYISRWIFLPLGNSIKLKPEGKKKHKIPLTMLVPTILLLVGAVSSGFFTPYLFHYFGEAEEFNMLSIVLSTSSVVAAILISYAVFYKKMIKPIVFVRSPLGIFHKIFVNKYWIDAAYDKFALGMFNFVFKALDYIDVFVIDRIVNLFNPVSEIFADTFKKMQSGVTQTYVVGILLGLLLLFAMLNADKIMLLLGV